jgi:hypothetical protein
MRVPLVILLLVLAAVAFAVTQRDDAPPPPNAPPVGAEERVPVEPPIAAPQRLSEPAGRAAPAVPPPAEHAAAPEQHAAASANTRLHVRGLATQQPLPKWRYRVRSQPGASGRVVASGEGGPEPLSMLLPAGPCELLVEADDCAPFVRGDLVVPESGPALALDIFLTPAVVQSGITLLAHDTARRPIPHVRVDAFPITDDNRNTNWTLGSYLWARRAANNDGKYVLPPLPAGEYGIRLVATDEHGTLLPLLPYTRAFALTGDNGFVEDVPLEDGCVPVFELVDANQQPFNPASFGPTMLVLKLSGGRAVQRKWLAGNAAATASAIDMLPGIGATWPAEAVPAGVYTFEVFVAGDPRVQRSIALRAGERQVERVIVP